MTWLFFQCISFHVVAAAATGCPAYFKNKVRYITDLVRTSWSAAVLLILLSCGGFKDLICLSYTVRLEPSSSSPRPQTSAGVQVGGSLPKLKWRGCVGRFAVPSVVVLTCVFVVWMRFLTLVTAALLEEESSTLHHEEAFAQTAKRNGGV